MQSIILSMILLVITISIPISFFLLLKYSPKCKKKEEMLSVSIPKTPIITTKRRLYDKPPMRFISSVNNNLTYNKPSIVGILTTNTPGLILNLYAQPLSPSGYFSAFYIRDKNGFIVPLGPE